MLHIPNLTGVSSNCHTARLMAVHHSSRGHCTQRTGSGREAHFGPDTSLTVLKFVLLYLHQYVFCILHTQLGFIHNRELGHSYITGLLCSISCFSVHGKEVLVIYQSQIRKKQRIKKDREQQTQKAFSHQGPVAYKSETAGLWT